MNRLPPPEFPDRLKGPLTRLNVAGAVTAADVAVARALTDANANEAVVEAIVLTSIALRAGHTCIDLADTTMLTALLSTERTEGDGDPGGAGLADPPKFPPLEAWTAALHESDAVEGLSDDEVLAFNRPLVFDPLRGRLWFARYARYEQRLADTLLERSQAETASGDHDELEAAVAETFGTTSRDAPQRNAVVNALSQPVSFITGGPGTGKTWTVARLVDVAGRLGLSGNDMVAMAAPTGKAAERMTEATGGTLRAKTLHRLLGMRPGLVTWDTDHPLPHRLVIVDEASMIALPMMTRLITSVRPDAHLVLVGDHNQLVSVEVGSVLGDIVDAASAETSALHDTVTRLTTIHRQDEASPIIAFAEAIRTGDADRVIELCAGDNADIRRIDPDSPDERELLDKVIDVLTEMIDAAEAGEVEKALDMAITYRVLTATRRGELGRSGWSDRIRRRLEFRANDWRVGRPVIVTRNDPVNGMSNGDTGIVVPAPDGADGVRVAFRSGDDIRLMAPTALRDVEDWWAMTIHKSQGSEYDHVAVSLPDRDSPILSRQLLYTAVTRAKRSVTIVASEATVRRAVTRPIARSSGLGDRLGA